MCDLQCVYETVAAAATGLRRKEALVQQRVNLRHKQWTEINMEDGEKKKAGNWTD